MDEHPAHEAPISIQAQSQSRPGTPKAGLSLSKLPNDLNVKRKTTLADVRKAVDASATSAADMGSHYITNVQTALVFNPYRDYGCEKTYDEEGDPEMESESNVARRESLRDHPALLDGLNRMVGLYTVRDEEGNITKDEYLTKYLQIVRLLMPTMAAEEARAEAMEDWENDADKEAAISPGALETALFQLVDLWCKSANVEEYVAFVDTLVGKMSEL